MKRPRGPHDGAELPRASSRPCVSRAITWSVPLKSRRRAREVHDLGRQASYSPRIVTIVAPSNSLGP